MTLEWQSMVSEPGEWATNGEGTWLAVWPAGDGFRAVAS